MGRKQRAATAGGLGQALLRHRAQGGRVAAGRYGAENKPLESITDVKDLDEVMEQAEIAGRVFSADNPLPELLIERESDAGGNLTAGEREQQRRAEEAVYRASLTVPRRPAWKVGMTAEQLDVQERQAFLTWRRGLVRLEENDNLVITPFEKNLDIWRQLWRVIERSDLVIMVVDCRNPLFYRCPDLEVYVREIDPNKKTMLLLNKADLLPATIRQRWANYFRKKGISFLFWSAKAASATLEGKLQDVKVEEDPVSDKDVAVLSRDELISRLQKEAELIASTRKDAARAMLAQHVGRQDGECLPDGASTVESTSRAANGGSASDADSRRVVVGFVGYPNVGKSSTINALVGSKKTGVTSTPGKTKHFQTLIINEKLVLCDCPGLVFPSFSSSRSEMVASGVLPIDRITDQRGPVEIVAQHVTRQELETVYGLKLPAPKRYEPQNRPASASELLRSYAHSRGQVASSGLPDETRAARQILKDYTSGKLFHCCLPPEDEPESTGSSVDSGYDSQEVGTHHETDSEAGHSDGEEEERDGVFVSGGESTSSYIDKAEDDSDMVGSRLGAKLLVVDLTTSEQGLVNIFSDLDNVENGGFAGAAAGRGSSKIRNAQSHKMHKKAPRKKDRSWRVGNDSSDGMPLVRGVLKPVSHGAKPLRQAVV